MSEKRKALELRRGLRLTGCAAWILSSIDRPGAESGVVGRGDAGGLSVPRRHVPYLSMLDPPIARVYGASNDVERRSIWGPQEFRCFCSWGTRATDRGDGRARRTNGNGYSHCQHQHHGRYLSGDVIPQRHLFLRWASIWANSRDAAERFVYFVNAEYFPLTDSVGCGQIGNGFGCRSSNRGMSGSPDHSRLGSLGASPPELPYRLLA